MRSDEEQNVMWLSVEQRVGKGRRSQRQGNGLSLLCGGRE